MYLVGGQREQCDGLVRAISVEQQAHSMTWEEMTRKSTAVMCLLPMPSQTYNTLFPTLSTYYTLRTYYTLSVVIFEKWLEREKTPCNRVQSQGFLLREKDHRRGKGRREISLWRQEQ